MSDLSNKLAAKKFASEDVLICLDGNLSSKRDQLVRNVYEASQKLAAMSKPENQTDSRLGVGAKGAKKELADAEAALSSLEASMRSESINIRFTAVSSGEYNKYLMQNPPRKGKNELFNPFTFYMFVARRTGQYVDDAGEAHDISKEEWDQLEASISDGEHERLAVAINKVNRVEGLQGLAFLSNGSAKTTVSSGTSEQPEPTE